MKVTMKRRRKSAKNNVLKFATVIFLSFFTVVIACPVYADDVKEKEVATYSYNPEGRPDPFKPLIETSRKKVGGGETKEAASLTALEKFSIDELKLAGIVTGNGKSVAMIEDTQGKCYPVSKGTLIGPQKGRVKEILADKIIIEEKVEYVSGETKVKHKIMKLHIESEEEP